VGRGGSGVKEKARDRSRWRYWSTKT
jgi:hypothetical protein